MLKRCSNDDPVLGLSTHYYSDECHVSKVKVEPSIE